MWRWFLVLIAFVALPGFSAFAKSHGIATAAAVTTCNINTGVATGLDAGTCASPAAVCDGVTDVSAAFTSFNTWAKATTTNANGQLIELRVTGVCVFATASTLAFPGLKNVRLWGYGATFQSDCCQPSLAPAGINLGFGFYTGICHKGLSDPNGCSARIASAPAGAYAVTLLNTALCSRFTAGQWGVVTGFDLQGSFGAPFGYPPNPHYFNYVKILSVANCATTGQLSLSTPLTQTYLSTWPNYNSGNAGEADAGGPATIYALDINWGGVVDIRGVKIVSANQTIYQGLSVESRDMTWAGSGCLIPSMNGSFVVVNGNMVSCSVEVDKIIKTYQLLGVKAGNITVQSSSIDTETVNNSSIGSFNGTARDTVVTNSTAVSALIGPIGYGRADSAVFTNVKITSNIGGTGLTEKTLNDIGANNFYVMSSGIITSVDAVNVTGFANNGSGLVRLTVSPGIPLTATNGFYNDLGVLTSGGANGYAVTVIDSTHVDLQGTNFSGAVWSGAGKLGSSALRWAMPGTNLFWVGTIDAEAPAFQVTGVTQDSAGTHVATTLAGGFPNLPFVGGNKLYLRIQSPEWTCTNCTGIADAIDFAGAPAATPMYSYSKRTYTNSTSLASHPVYGKVTSIKFNVTQAYTGSTTPLVFQMVENTVIPAGTTTFYVANIDLRTAGLRTITPAGVTCNTGGGPVAGGCGADSGLTLPDPAVFFATSANPQMSTSPVDQPWTMSVEFIMDQGVVVPPP
jgi:hypothetical protein